MQLGRFERHIQYLYEAAQAGTMSAASERLNLATSSISRQITQLEENLGTSLIEKGRRQIKLTQAGELLIQYYKQRRSHDEAFLSEFQSLRGNRTGKIVLAVGEGFSGEGFSQVLTEFMRENEYISLSAFIADTNHLLRMVREDDAHIGLVLNPAPDPKIRANFTMSQPLTVIAHPDHEIAGLSSVTVAELAKYKVGVPSRPYSIRQLLETISPPPDFLASPSLSTNSLALLKNFVKTGQGVAILTSIVVMDEVRTGELVAIPIEDANLIVPELHVVTRIGRILPVPARHLLHSIERALLTAQG